MAGIDRAVWEINSANMAPGIDRIRGCQNRHRLHEILEQQHQHQIDAEDAGGHGEAESFEQLGHRLGIAQGGLADAGRQLLQAG